MRARQLAADGEGRRLREAAGLSVRFLADELGIHHTTLLRWEAGHFPHHRSAALLRWEATLRRLGERQAS